VTPFALALVILGVRELLLGRRRGLAPPAPEASPEPLAALPVIELGPIEEEENAPRRAAG
jgi:hypothetical protein